MNEFVEKLLKSTLDVAAFKSCCLDEQFVATLLRSGELSYVQLTKLDDVVRSKPKEFRNESSFICYLIDLYDDYFTTEYDINPDVQKSIVSDLRVYDFLLDRVNAKFEKFDQLLSVALRNDLCRSYCEQARLSIGVPFDADETRSVFSELKRISSKSQSAKAV